MLIRDAGPVWSLPITLVEDEVWQSRVGVVCVSTDDDPELEAGLELAPRDGVRLSAGRAVRYRRVGDELALISRERV